MNAKIVQNSYFRIIVLDFGELAQSQRRGLSAHGSSLSIYEKKFSTLLFVPSVEELTERRNISATDNKMPCEADIFIGKRG
jgi:hypothetical protein